MASARPWDTAAGEGGEGVRGEGVFVTPFRSTRAFFFVMFYVNYKPVESRWIPSPPPLPRECQTKDWQAHRIVCRGGRPVPVGLPFVVSLPSSRLTYSNLATMAEKFARYVSPKG